MKDEALCQYFAASPAWQRQLEQLRKKCLAGYADGWIQLHDASPEECRAAEGLLGRHFIPPRLRYKMSDWEQALRASRFAVSDLTEFWLRMDGQPLIPRSQQKATRQTSIQDFFAAEQALPHQNAAQSWLHTMVQEKISGYQILLPHIGEGDAAAQWLHWVCCALDRLYQNSEPEELALCSYAVSTDPHVLDVQNPAGKLLLHALAYWQGCPVPARSRERTALYRRCGLLLDDISCFTVQRGLTLTLANGQEHPASALLRQQGRFCLLTLSQLEDLQAAASSTGRVYILENQMVFSTLCRRSGLVQPMICTSGQLKEASWRLLDLLAKTDCQFYYAGDFDPEGLGIADHLWQEYGNRVHFWHMTAKDYWMALSQKRITADSRLLQLENIGCPALKPVAWLILQQKVAGYQEALVEQYSEDLKKDSAVVEPHK